MKKYIKTLVIGLFLVVFSCCAGLMLSACGEHQHTYGSWKVTKEATCTEEGTEEATCTECGETATKVIAAKGHDWQQWEVTKPAKCEETGITERQCLTCGDEEQNIISATGHLMGFVHNEHFHTYKCLNDGCNKAEEPASHVMDLIRTEEKEHGFCHETGKQYFECKDCHYLNTITIEATNHEWSAYSVEDGKVEHRRTCHNCHYEQIAPCEFDHEDPEKYQEIEPTCTLGGTIIEICTVCGGEYHAKNGEALGHSWENKDSDEGWVFDGEALTHSRKCERGDCGFEETFSCREHIIIERDEEATCTKAGILVEKCSICGGEKTTNREMLQHTYDDEHFKVLSEGYSAKSRKHILYCTVCGGAEKQVDCTTTMHEKPHDCFNPGYNVYTCKICSMVSQEESGVPKREHSFDSHYYQQDGSEEHYLVCQYEDCGYHQVTSCNMQETSTPATCTDDGKNEYDCELCGRHREEIVSALGHKFEGAGYEKYHIDTTYNKHYRTCSTCKERIEEKHNYAECNICVCGKDGLEYQLIDGMYWVSGYGEAVGTKSLVIDSKRNGSENVNVRGIKDKALMGNKNLLSVELKDGITNIGTIAFYDCTNIANIIAPTTLTEIASDSFDRNGSEIIPYFSQAGAYYLGNILYYIKDINSILDNGTFEVKSGTTQIMTMVFYNCENIDELILPASLKQIQSHAFYGCNNIKKVVFKGSFEEWFKIEFRGIYSNPVEFDGADLHIETVQDSVTIPEGATTIPAGTFVNDDIKSIVIPSTVTYIGDNAFRGSSLANITIHSKNLTYIGLNAFLDTPLYKSWSEGSKETLQSGYDALYLSVTAEDGSDLQMFYLIKVRELTEGSFTVKEGTVSIGSGAFANCASLSEVTIAESVGSMGALLFSGCNEKISIKFVDAGSAWKVSGEILIRQITVSSSESISSFILYNRSWVKVKIQSNITEE